MIWLVLGSLMPPEALDDIVLLDKTGVETLKEGRLRAAGSISGIANKDWYQ